jgi:hypothetical protein
LGSREEKMTLIDLINVKTGFREEKMTLIALINVKTEFKEEEMMSIALIFNNPRSLSNEPGVSQKIPKI